MMLRNCAIGAAYWFTAAMGSRAYGQSDVNLAGDKEFLELLSAKHPCKAVAFDVRRHSGLMSKEHACVLVQNAIASVRTGAALNVGVPATLADSIVGASVGGFATDGKALGGEPGGWWFVTLRFRNEPKGVEVRFDRVDKTVAVGRAALK